MLPKMPVEITFNPIGQEWWEHPEARKLVLLWKPGHITSQYFYESALRNGKRIEELKPQTPEALRDCLSGMDFNAGDYSTGDAAQFSKEALPYFIGEKEVSFVII